MSRRHVYRSTYIHPDKRNEREPHTLASLITTTLTIIICATAAIIYGASL